MQVVLRCFVSFFMAYALLASPQAIAFDVHVDIDIDSPLDLLPKPKPPKKAAPAKPAEPAKPKPAAKKPSTAHLPAKGEKRLRDGELLVEARADLLDDDLAALADRQDLRLIETAFVTLLGTDVHLFAIEGERSLNATLNRLATEPEVILAQPNYTYALLEDDTARATAPPQYAAELLHLSEAHAIATGLNVRIGILDTAVVDTGPELEGSVTLHYDGIGAIEGVDDPSHGTALAGIVAAHDQLAGVAPGATLLAARAFAAPEGEPPSSSSFVLIKGLDWLAVNGAMVVNMSFAGPSDPLFLKEIKGAREKGIVAVAAAGNGGPKAPPAFPAADPNVIGITAIDDLGELLPEANRGDYVAFAAPGVDVLIVSPSGAYGTSSGTSMAAAHVSGAIALLLERNPSLTPDDIAALLGKTALDLGKKGRDKTFGLGLIDPVKALADLPVLAASTVQP